MKIKKCPFCGGDHIDFDIDYGSYGYTPNVYHIECCVCGASMSLVDDFQKSNEECRDILIERWNKRTEDKSEWQQDHEILKAYSDGANDTLDKVLEAIDDCNSDGLTGIFCSYADGERFKEYIKDLYLSPATIENKESEE